MEYILHVIGFVALYSDNVEDNLIFECYMKQKLLNIYNQKDYLLSSKKCLNCAFGRRYLFHFLHQTSCDELVLFIKEYFKYKSKPASKEQLMIIQQITKNFIHPNSKYCLNISYGCRKTVCFYLSICTFS